MICLWAPKEREAKEPEAADRQASAAASTANPALNPPARRRLNLAEGLQGLPPGRQLRCWGCWTALIENSCSRDIHFRRENSCSKDIHFRRETLLLVAHNIYIRSALGWKIPFVFLELYSEAPQKPKSEHGFACSSSPSVNPDWARIFSWPGDEV